MIKKSIWNYLFNVRFIVVETLENRISPIYQFFSVLFLLFYEKGVWFELFASGKNEIYFSKSVTLEFVLLAVGVACLFLFFKKYGINQIASIFLNTYFTSKLWTLIFFFVYTLITIPISFYMDQNLIGDPSSVFKGIGYLILTLLPTAIVILSSRAILMD